MIREDLKARVIKWAEDRNFFGPGGATVEGQLAKLLEEASELVTSIVRGRDATDDIGDCLVVLTILERMGVKVHFLTDEERAVKITGNSFERAFWFIDSIAAQAISRGEFSVGHPIDAWELTDTAALLNIDPNAALEHALREIEPRKGSWSGGVFVKEAA